ncbi:PLD nuclease N-terminal domain-containing protein [Limibaculum sp. FT325]|uniref:PLD nuclease N-terminal domain-containing protein n=1 Tax=Thermohalobaculum sediminis TaxID=2939436 RepID=UPI0020BE8484|nr:PLD nuclease N-terminal domain-containing protein [Limibaculum sediminis]MCL5777520.1 PLD nuclease N-terminal domain-containing protein [Limibaculum sediminis]
MSLELVGFGALALLAINTWAIVSVLGSGRPAGAKAMWTALVLMLPVAGFLAWLMAGPREREYRL